MTCPLCKGPIDRLGFADATAARRLLELETAIRSCRIALVAHAMHGEHADTRFRLGEAVEIFDEMMGDRHE